MDLRHHSLYKTPSLTLAITSPIKIAFDVNLRIFAEIFHCKTGIFCNLFLTRSIIPGLVSTFVVVFATFVGR